MKSKLSAAIVAVSAMLMSAGALAYPVCGSATVDTVLEWQTNPCVDSVDGDTIFTWASNTIPDNTVFGVDEFELGGTLELYVVSFDWPTSSFPGGYAPPANGATIAYTVTATDLSEPFSSANLDTIVQGTGADAIKQLFDIGSGTPFLTLESVNGSRDPAQGETSFGPRISFDVVDTFSQPGTAVFTHAENSFNVPEPTSLALLGLGLAGLGFSRRKK